MKFENWDIENSNTINPASFYELIQNNAGHIENTFPITLNCCATLQKTQEFLNKSRRKQNEKDGYYFYIRNTEKQKLMGYLCVKNINRSIMKCELAYFIDKNFEGNGIISKAVSQTVAFCFGELQMNKV